jgi:hypothetical protein
MKIGDLVEFSYGRVGGQITGIGIFAERGYSGKHKVLFMNKVYWVPEQFIKCISMQRKDPANDVKDN